MSDFTIYFLAAVATVLLLAFVLWHEYSKAKARKAKWIKIAKKTGLIYSFKAPEILVEYKKMNELGIGENPSITNCLRGFKDDVEIIVADFSYVTKLGDSFTVWKQTLCILRLKELNMPRCNLLPEALGLDYLIKILGGQDINFENDFAFSSDFILKGSDEYDVKTYFSQKVRNCFVSLKKEDIRFEAFEDVVLFHYSRFIEPAEMPQMLANGLEIVEALKENIAQ